MILEYLYDNKINNLIIAGDLLDKDFDGYHEIDESASKFPDINITAIPGNHDLTLEQKFFNSRIVWTALWGRDLAWYDARLGFV